MGYNTNYIFFHFTVWTIKTARKMRREYFNKTEKATRFYVSNILHFLFISRANSYIKAFAPDNNLHFIGHKRFPAKYTNNTSFVKCIH
jgi:hypothetical protein